MLLAIPRNLIYLILPFVLMKFPLKKFYSNEGILASHIYYTTIVYNFNISMSDNVSMCHSKYIIIHWKFINID